MSTRTTRWMLRLVVAVGAVVALAGCKLEDGKLDAIAIAELKDCPRHILPSEVMPPPGAYADPGYALDYDLLVPWSDPQNGDRNALAALWTHSRQLEQVYHDAASGHLRAGYFACVSEVAVAWHARRFARRMARPDCGTVRSCAMDYEQIKLDTRYASIRRILAIVRDSFEAEAFRIGLKRQVVAELGALLGVTVGVVRLTARSRIPRAGSRTQAHGERPARVTARSQTHAGTQGAAEPPGPRSLGAAAAKGDSLGWHWTQGTRFGHTFTRHGHGPKRTRGLTGRARGWRRQQGQWLDNQATAEFLRGQRPYLKDGVATEVELPPGVPGQVILPDGSIVPAKHAKLVPKGDAQYETAYPWIPGKK